MSPNNTQTTKTILKNGLRLIIKPNKSNPSVSFKIAILGGLLVEDEKNNGITNFISQTWTRGTKKYSNEELCLQIESMASMIYGFSSQNSISLTGQSLSRNFLKTLKLAVEILKNPTFENKEIEKVRPMILEEINRELDNPIKKSFDLFSEILFKNHPYALNQLGKIKNIKNFNQKILQEKYFSLLDPKQIVITIVGDVKLKETIEFLEANLSDLNSKNKQKIVNFSPNFNAKSQKKLLKIEKNQSNIVLGFEGLAMDDPNIYSLEILKKVLAGMGGRLFINLRDKQSLAYSLTALQKSGFKCPGFFATYIGCAPEKADHAVEELRRELKEIREKGITDKELNDAKNFLTGVFAVNFQSNSAQANKLCSDELYGLGYDFDNNYEEKINKVTKKEVLKIARKIIDLNREVLVIVGP